VVKSEEERSRTSFYAEASAFVLQGRTNLREIGVARDKYMGIVDNPIFSCQDSKSYADAFFNIMRLTWA